MTHAIAIYLFFIAFVLAVFVAWEHFTRRHDILSMRNMAIVGFIIFQVTSAALRLWTGIYYPYRISDPGKSGLIFAAWSTIFAIVFLFVYRRGWFADWAARRTPSSRARPGDPTLLAMAVVLALGAAILRAMDMFHLVSILTEFWGNGLAAVSAGLVGWVWAKRLFNPAVAAIAIAIVAFNMVVMMSGEFGRRGIVAVGGGLVWGMFYSAWRTMPHGPMLARLSLLSLPPVLFVALYTSVRSSSEHDRTAGQQVSAITSGGSLKTGILLLLDGQNTGATSLWAIESYPERYAMRHLFTVRYYLTYPVPRSIWPSKPKPLSQLVASQADVPKVQQDKITLPAGILGNIAAEGGWYVLFLYPALGAIFVRYFDRLIQLNVESPFIVLSAASALGQVIGLARGETSAFAMQFTLTFIFTWGSLIIVAKVVERLMGARGALPEGEPHYAYEEYADEYDDYAVERA